MGLDTVELVMTIEEEFNLEIVPAAAEKMVTVGDLADYVVATLRHRAESPDEEQIWERVKQIVVDRLGVKPEQVICSARFVRDLGAD